MKKYNRFTAVCLAAMVAFSPMVSTGLPLTSTVMAATTAAKPTESRITNLTTSVVDGVNTVSVNWSKAENTTAYRIYYKEAGGSWELMKSFGSAKTSAVLSSTANHPIESGVTYYFTVRTYNKNSGKYGLWDKTGTKVCFQAETPGRADIISAVPSVKSGVNSVTLTWSAATNTTNYKVYYKEVGGSWKRIKTLAASKTSGTFYSTDANTFNTGVVYLFTVRSYNNETGKYGAWDKKGTRVAFVSQGQDNPSTPSQPSKPAPTPKPSQSGQVKVDWIEIPGGWLGGNRGLSQGSFKIDIAFHPSNASDKSLRWTSSNPAVATVSQDGTVTMKAGGDTTINIYAADGASTNYDLTVIDENSEAQKIFELTNQERVKNGKTPLKYNMLMQKAAMIRAKELKAKYSHTRPDGRTSGTALEDLGGGTNIRENIARSAIAQEDTTKGTIEGWMNSSGHRSAMLGSYQYMGAGVYVDENGVVYFVQEFANFDPEKTVTVYLDNNGGTGPTSATFLNQKKIYQDDLPVPVRPGYVFKGWTMPDHDNVIFKSVTAQENHKYTFVAVWTSIA